MTLPEEVRKAAERLTRLAREAEDDESGVVDDDEDEEVDDDMAVDGEAAAHRERRDELLAEHGYTARVREDDTRDVLVFYPAEWTDDEGLVDVAQVDDVDRGFEVPLSGPGDEADWDVVEAHNRAAAERVAAEYGEVHGENAHAFADFMGNHYAKPVEEATPGEVEEFLADYFPRNSWPTDEQRAVVEASVELVREASEGE